MATIITKNSQTASAVPSAASLSVGELAVNTADGKLYTEHTGGVVKEIIPSTVVDDGITNAKIANGAVTPAKLSTGAPSWNTSGNVTVSGTLVLPSGSDLSWGGSYSSGAPTIAANTSSGVLFYPNGLTSNTRFRISPIGGLEGVIAGVDSAMRNIYSSWAWVNFNGTGTVAIRASGNVSSITDNGTGDYRVNFIQGMPDTNYATICSSNNNNASNGWSIASPYLFNQGSVGIVSGYSTQNDQTVVTVAIFR